MDYLLDTCVISELVAKRPNNAVVQWIDSIDENSLYLSAITIGEIRKGIEKLLGSERKDTPTEGSQTQGLGSSSRVVDGPEAADGIAPRHILPQGYKGLCGLVSRQVRKE